MTLNPSLSLSTSDECPPCIISEPPSANDEGLLDSKDEGPLDSKESPTTGLAVPAVHCQSPTAGSADPAADLQETTSAERIGATSTEPDCSSLAPDSDAHDAELGAHLQETASAEPDCPAAGCQSLVADSDFHSASVLATTTGVVVQTSTRSSVLSAGAQTSSSKVCENGEMGISVDVGVDLDNSSDLGSSPEAQSRRDVATEVDMTMNNFDCSECHRSLSASICRDCVKDLDGNIKSLIEHKLKVLSQDMQGRIDSLQTECRRLSSIVNEQKKQIQSLSDRQKHVISMTKDDRLAQDQYPNKIRNSQQTASVKTKTAEDIAGKDSVKDNMESDSDKSNMVEDTTERDSDKDNKTCDNDKRKPDLHGNSADYVSNPHTDKHHVPPPKFKIHLPPPGRVTNFIIGDSNLKNIDRQRLDRTGRTHVRTMPGARVSDITASLKHSARRDDIKRVAVLVGGNDLCKDTPKETLLTDFSNLLPELKRVFPCAKLAVSALLPKKPVPLHVIIALNREIQRLCAEVGVVYFIEPRFVSRGTVVKSCFSSDGVHLSSSGLSLWLRQVSAILEISRSQGANMSNTQALNSKSDDKSLPPRLSAARAGLHAHVHHERHTYEKRQGTSSSSSALSSSKPNANGWADPSHSSSQTTMNAGQPNGLNVQGDLASQEKSTCMPPTHCEQSKSSNWQSADMLRTPSDHSEQPNWQSSQSERSNPPHSLPSIFSAYRFPSHNRPIPMYPPWWNSFHPMMFNPLMFMQPPH